MNKATRSRSRRRALLLALVLTLVPAVVLATGLALVNPSLPWSYAGGASAQLQGGAYTMNGAVGHVGASTAPATGGSYSLVGSYNPPPVATPAGVTPRIYLPIAKK